MTKKFRIIAVLFVLSLLLIFVGCNNNEDASGNGNNNNDNTENNDNNDNNNNNNNNDELEEVELRYMWWGSQTRHDRILELIDLFEGENPHITINYEFLSFGDFGERLATQSAAGNAPDVFHIVDRWLPQYSDAGLLADLQPFIDSGAINTDHVEQSSLDPGYIGNELVALNAGSNAFALVYDPAMFDEAGVDYPEPGYTWDEYVEMGIEVRDALDLPYAVQMDAAHDREFGINLRQNGYWLYNDDATGPGWEDDDLFLDYVNFWMDLIDDGIAPPPDVTSAADSLENYLIIHEQIPMQVIHSNQIVAVASAANRDFELTILPSGENGESGQYIRASMFLAMNANTEHPDEVAMFLDFMTNNKEAHEIMQGDLGVPISAEIREHLYADAERTVQQQFDYIELIGQHAADAPPPPPSIGQEVDNFFEDVIDEVRYGVTSPEEALEKYRDGVVDIIERAD
ncbi:sugar ABC transporter substrate-binding protein [Evansella sp. AB-P1]|uniref:ABC transporter substrate-binding protein n=1 Tax=Evansella sp. AB-P1 TaxID=3037653 RepID=UPI00241FC123|nr:sugar ABC transporter substrate-binding protein [Evansella sp. AB-P1]MDG5786747.1 sugar ABC transporter substrate-binding protein [Evansella sp. AB-P1]